jgi:hypothetical protein
MTKKSDAPRRRARKVVALLALSLLALALTPARARAQWSQPTQPDTNIHNINGGNVGIGTDTTPPSERLVTIGNLLSGNVTAHTKLYQGYDPQANSIFELGYATPTSLIAPFASFVLSKNVTSGGNVIGTLSFANSGIPDGSDKRLAAIQGWTGGTTTSGNLRFHVMNGGTLSERMRLDASGNLGIGTASPLSQLHVEGGSLSGQVRVSGTGLAALNLRDNGGPTDAKFYQVRTDGGLFRLNLINDLENAFVQQNILVANSAGMVGIGTASPSSKLSVEGSGYTVGATAAPYYEGFRVRASDFSTTGGYLLFGKQTGSGYGVIQAGDNAGYRNIVLNPSGGNIGIGPGMTMPAEALTVNGNISVHRGASPGPAELRIYNGGQTAEWAFRQASATSHDLKISKAVAGVYTDYMTVSTAGNVGVGVTPSPQYRLDVAGAANVSGNLTVTQSITGGTINAVYQDVAEWVPSSQKLAPGTVVVLDTERANHVLASTTSYDTKVAGVVSERPGISLGEGGRARHSWRRRAG